MSILGSGINKSTLINLVDQGKIEPINIKGWFDGHRPTNFELWYNSSKPYTIKWTPHFEPYVIVKLKDLPKFDERFVGYGYDKITFFLELHAMNYSMVGHPSAFVVHRPHVKSKDSIQYTADKTYMGCINNLKEQFVNELVKKYSIDSKIYLS